ncbi:MAG: hypothetical protein J6K62_02590 [Clostridia bacterium]|nr:hypothetical protein [Clostridia bacterium]
MIKGVSRQIVEVTGTGSPYFERAFLVVRPACADEDEELLHDEAQRVLQSQEGYTGLRRARRQRRWQRFALLLLGGALSLLIEKLMLTLWG